MKPDTLDASQVFYVDSGGHLMQLGTKEHMEERGYKLTVGHKRASMKTTYIKSENVDSIISNADIGIFISCTHFAIYSSNSFKDFLYSFTSSSFQFEY